MSLRNVVIALVGLALIALPFVYRDPYHLHILILILIGAFPSWPYSRWRRSASTSTRCSGN